MTKVFDGMIEHWLKNRKSESVSVVRPGRRARGANSTNVDRAGNRVWRFGEGWGKVRRSGRIPDAWNAVPLAPGSRSVTPVGRLNNMVRQGWQQTTTTSFLLRRSSSSTYVYLPTNYRTYSHPHITKSIASTRELRGSTLRYAIYITFHVPPKLVSLPLTFHHVVFSRLSNLAS